MAKVKGYYRVSLESVDVNVAGGEIVNVQGANKFTYPTYEDENIGIKFVFEPTHIDFTLQNKSNSSLRIIWDDAIYVGGPNGVSDGVFHSGIRLIDRDKSQTPSIIVKGTMLSDVIITKSGVSFSTSFGRWMYNYILYWQHHLKNIKLLLPIEKNGVTYEYLFNFSVVWEDVKVKSRIYGGKEYYIQIK